MKKNLLAIILISTATFALFSCKKDKDSNEINDSQGVNVKLTWTINDGSTATAGADVDFYIYKGVGAAKEPTPEVSGNNTGFEDESFLSSLADGDYTVEIEYYDVVKDGKFSITFTAITGTKSYSFNDNGFVVANEGQTKDFIKINKSGTKFTISKM